MNVDWDSVKQQTLWRYEDLIAKLLNTLAYPFVREHYDHTMEQAQGYAKEIRRGYLEDRGDMTVYVDRIATHLEKLDTRAIGTYSELVHRVATPEQCVTFLEQMDLDFELLIETLNYLFRWVLPFKAPVREFVDAGDAADARCLAALKQQKIGSNLDLLEAGRTQVGRVRLASTAEMPEAHILALVHRVDISRLAYVRGKTVKHLCGGGYDSLAGAELAAWQTWPAQQLRQMSSRCRR